MVKQMSFFPKKIGLNRTKQRYQPNLVSLMTLCANNYLLFVKILADKQQAGEVREFCIGESLAYKVTIVEVTRYTSLITFEQQIWQSTDLHVAPAFSDLLKPSMRIRLYHDACAAEVISSQGIKQVKPRYDYPNINMHQEDEKQQINQFLNEWLHLCLCLGQVNIELPS
jgi:hypothetical protein